MQSQSEWRWDDMRLVLALFRRGSLKAAAVVLVVTQKRSFLDRHEAEARKLAHGIAAV